MNARHRLTLPAVGNREFFGFDLEFSGFDLEFSGFDLEFFGFDLESFGFGFMAKQSAQPID